MTIINNELNHKLYINSKKENNRPVSVFSNDSYKADPSSWVNPSLENFKANFVSFKATPKPEVVNINVKMPLSLNFLDKTDERFKYIFEQSVKYAVNSNSKYLTGVYCLAALINDAIDYINDQSNFNYKPILIKQIEKIIPDFQSNYQKKALMAAHFQPILEQLLVSVPLEKLGDSTEVIAESDFDNVLSNTLNKLTENSKISVFPNDGAILSAIQEMPADSLSKVIYTFLMSTIKSLSENTNTEPIDLVKQDSMPNVKKISHIKSSKSLPNIQGYENTANFLASIMASDTNNRVMLINDKGSIPKVVMQDFSNKINNNKYPNLKPDKTNVVYYSAAEILGNPEILNQLSQAALADRSKKTIVFIDNFEQLVSDFFHSQNDDLGENNGLTPYDKIMAIDVIPNLSFVTMLDSEFYADIMSTDSEADPMLIGTKADFKSFYPLQMTSIGPNETFDFIKRLLIDLPEEFKNKFTQEAIKQIIYMSHRIKGFNPGKTLNLLNLIDSTFAHENKKVITKTDVEKFIKSYGDFLYSPSFSLTDYYPVSKNKLQDYILTKKSLEQVREFINHINTSKKQKNCSLNNFWNKTIITGSSAEERLKLVQTIATETKLPILSLKTSKMVNYFYNNTEMPLSLVFNNLKLIAKDNPTKTAILYIEDINALADQNSMELTDTHQKVGINKLFQEIEKLQQEGLNIVVIGSSEDETQLNNEIYKVGGFNEEINLPSAAFDKAFRKQLISHYVKQHKIKFQEDSIDLLGFLSEITFGAEKADIESIIERARDLSKTNKIEGISRNNIKEAFARNDTGHIQDINLSDDDKKLLIAHEFGHYLTDLVMYEIAKDSRKSWALSYHPYLIDINTRKDYLGATFFVNDGHISQSLEAVFARLVSGFGGEAGESSVYDITSSSGISSDLRSATNQSLLNILYLGMGDKSGRISLPYHLLPANEQTRVLKQAKIWNHNAQIASKMITFAYKGFLEKMMNEFYTKVGTGHIVDSEEFDKYFHQFLQDNKNNTDFNRTISELKEKIPKIIADTINCRKTLTSEQEERLKIEEQMVRGNNNN